jgi:putative membrane protein
MLSWRKLFPDERTPHFKTISIAFWIGRAVNTLLPVATIGGEVLKARLLMLWGESGTDASASVVVDKSVQVLALILWGLVGIGLLLYFSVDNELAIAAAGGFALLSAGVAGFVVVQRAGMFGYLMKFGGKFINNDQMDHLSGKADRIDQIVLALYRRPGRIVVAVLWRFLSLVMQTTEVWLAAYLLGHPIGLLEAMMLKSLVSTLSDIAFVIPNAYGVQEGLYILLGAFFGIPGETMLALSLITRLRELVIDVPGLIAWQRIEGKELLKLRKMQVSDSV